MRLNSMLHDQWPCAVSMGAHSLSIDYLNTLNPVGWPTTHAGRLLGEGLVLMAIMCMSPRDDHMHPCSP